MSNRRSTTPTKRSLDLLRREGFTAAIVERRLPHCMITVDAFGLFDLLAVRADVPGVAGIQTTTGTNHTSRVRKLFGCPTLRTWLAALNRAEVWSWAKRRGRWAVRRQRIEMADIDAANAVEMTEGDSA